MNVFRLQLAHSKILVKARGRLEFSITPTQTTIIARCASPWGWHGGNTLISSAGPPRLHRRPQTRCTGTHTLLAPNGLITSCSTHCAFTFAGVAGMRRTHRTNQLNHPASSAAVPAKCTICVIPPLVVLNVSRLVHEANRTLGIEDGYTPAYKHEGRLARRVPGSARQGIEDQNRVPTCSGHSCGFNAC